MNLAAGEHPYEPCVYSSEAELAFIGLLACSRHVFEDPEDLCGAEICVNDEAGLASDEVCAAVSLETVAEF